jgi:hypothetical protein
VRCSLGSTAAGLQLRKNCFSERGPGATGRERAHRRVSRVADGKEKLTGALDGAQAQRRPWNKRCTSAGGGGALGSRGQSEREGEGAGQRAQMGEGRWASRARGSKGARGLVRGRRTRGRGRIHGGEIVGERLKTADKFGRRDRERGAGARGRTSTDRSGPRDREREREGERRDRVDADRRDPPVRQRARAGADARKGAGLSGLPWAELAFPFSWNFYLLFYLFSLGFSIQIQIKFQIQTKSNMCNNSKNI